MKKYFSTLATKCDWLLRLGRHVLEMDAVRVVNRNGFEYGLEGVVVL